MSAFDTIARGIRDIMVLQERFAGFDRSLSGIEGRLDRLADNVLLLDRRLATLEGRLQGRADTVHETELRRLPRP